MFAEDAARTVRLALDECPDIADFLVQTVHYESLHAHNAVAVASKGVENGLSPAHLAP